MSLVTSNNVKLIVASAVGTGDTTISLVSTTGLPDVSDPSDYTIATLIRLSDGLYEIVRIDSITGNDLTVQRAQEGTAALTFSGGDAVRNYFTSGMFTQFTFEADSAVSAAAAAAVSETNAAASESAAATSETNAATSESNAATSETNAATSASNAATSETNAATSESNAATSASNAATSEANAATSEANAAATLANSVKLAANFTDNALIKGDGVAKDAQVTGIIVDDSDNVSGVPRLNLESDLELDEVAAPATPAAGKVRLYAKTDSKVYIKDDTGTETEVGAGGGGDVFGETNNNVHVDTDTIDADEWDESGSGAGSCDTTNEYASATDGTVNLTASASLAAGDKCRLITTGAGTCTWTLTTGTNMFNYNSNITQIVQSAGDAPLTVIFKGGDDFEVQ